MSSVSPSALLRSTIFRRTFLSGLIGAVGLILLVWLGFAVHKAQTLGEVRSSLAEEMEALEGLYASEGLNGLVAALSFDGRTLWDPDWLYAILEQDEFIARVLTSEDETLAGFEEIDPPGGQASTFVEHEELSGHRVLSFRMPLEGGEVELVVARFVPDRLLILEEWLVQASWLVLLAVMPVSLLTGFFTSRTAFRRLDTISATAETIDEGQMDARVPLEGNWDEFDRLSFAVNEMLDRIGALTRNLEGVSAGVAHDLKTPVSNLAGRLQLLERDAGDPEAVATHIAASQAHITTLVRTLDAMLRLGEVEGGGRRRAFATIDLSDLVEDVADSFLPLFEDADKRFDVRTEARVFVNGDQDLLIQLLSNLLENALEHSREGANTWIRLRALDGKAWLEVGDDGPGLPAPAVDSVFDRFVRLDVSRSMPGNGLGLSLVRAIAELHHGEARVAQTAPGAVFEVSFPLRET